MRLIIIDLREGPLFREDDVIEVTEKFKNNNNFLVGLLVSSAQHGLISQHFPGGAMRYVGGSYYGFLEDVLCYDNAHGSFMILTISELAARNKNKEGCL